MIVAHRKVTRDMLTRADAIFAVDPAAPLEERPLFTSELPDHGAVHTLRVLLVLLEPNEIQHQIQLLRFRIAEAKSGPRVRNPSPAYDYLRYAASLEWMEYKA